MRSSLVLLCTLLAGVASASEIYKWTDKNGRTQYSDRPPPAEYAAERRGPLPTEAAADAQQAAAAGDELTADQRCAVARARLQALRRNTAAAVDRDGMALDAAGREEQILEAQRNEESLCADSTAAPAS